MNKKLLMITTVFIFVFVMCGAASAVIVVDKPNVTSVDPVNNSVNVSPNKVIKVTFNEDVKAGTNWIELKNSSGTTIPITKTISGNTLTINHSNPLKIGTKYTISLHTGSITDLSGISLNAYVFSFITDGTPPTVTSSDPTNNTVNVAQNKVIKVTFSEPVKWGNWWIELKNSSGAVIPITKSITGTVLTINHAALLKAGTKYTIYLHSGSVNDYAGNPLAGCIRSFTTAETDYNTNSPSFPTKIIFIHHSCGENWLSDSNGGLGLILRNNNYFVSDTNYGWGLDAIGSSTDTSDWLTWFIGPNSNTYMGDLYSESGQNSDYSRLATDPSGENEIIMFKSCFPNSEVGDSIDDEKAIYNSLKTYFAAHSDKLFVLITPPGEINVESYQLTRELCSWLVDKENGWLAGYAGKNVFTFDFYGVLSEINSHHRYISGNIEHVYAADYDGNSPYHNGDDHPNELGNKKATNEFITLLNIAYNQWKS